MSQHIFIVQICIKKNINTTPINSLSPLVKANKTQSSESGHQDIILQSRSCCQGAGSLEQLSGQTPVFSKDMYSSCRSVFLIITFALFFQSYKKMAAKDFFFSSSTKPY